MIYERDDKPGSWTASRIGGIVLAWGIVTLAWFLIGTFWPAEGHRRPHLWETLAIPGSMLVVGAVLLAWGRRRVPTTTPEWLLDRLTQYGNDPSTIQVPPRPDRVNDRKYIIPRPKPKRPRPEFRPEDVIRSEKCPPGGYIRMDAPDYQSHIYVREDLAGEPLSFGEFEGEAL